MISEPLAIVIAGGIFATIPVLATVYTTRAAASDKLAADRLLVLRLDAQDQKLQQVHEVTTKTEMLVNDRATKQEQRIDTLTNTNLKLVDAVIQQAGDQTAPHPEVPQ